MPNWGIAFFVAALLFRISTLIISIRHEKQLKRQGAIEYGARNSALLALAIFPFISR
jgi:isoprenylcysteine carboxyl methyltransferase (ICMT) family protein YpbQ